MLKIPTETLTKQVQFVKIFNTNFRRIIHERVQCEEVL